MNIRPAFIANSQAAELVQPSDGTLDDPSGLAQSTAMLSVTASNLTFNPPCTQGLAMRLAVIRAIGLQHLGLAQRTADLSSDWRDRVHQRQQLRNVVSVRFGQNNAQGNALRVAEDVVFRARFTAIGWVRSSFFPPCTARTLELSATAREKSILSASRKRVSNAACNRSHTPACCHACKRRQQLMPEPQPISRGSICQGIPDLSTNRMPVSNLRSSMGLRPGWVLRRRFGRGSSGSMIDHSSSSTNSRAILPRKNNKIRGIVPVNNSFCYGLLVKAQWATAIAVTLS